METLQLISTFALFAFLFHAVITGFKISFFWGVGNLFLNLVLMPFYYYKYRDRYFKWSISFLLVYSVFWGATIFDAYQAIGISIIIIGVVIFIATLSPVLTYNLKSKLNSGKFDIADNSLDLRTLKGLKKSHKSHLNQLKGKSHLKYLSSFLNQKDFRDDLFNYVNKYLIFDTDGGALVKDLSDERFKYFQKMVMEKYGISSRGLTLITLWVSEEFSYEEYLNKINVSKNSEPFKIFSEIIHYDIERGIQTPDAWLQRVLEDMGVEKKYVVNRRRKYAQAKEKIKLQYFQESLDEDTVVLNSFDSEIRDKRRRENEIKKANEIKEKIGNLIEDDLDLSPENYLIVPEDYSRDSRIDRFYKNNFSKILSRAFDGHCCKCGEGMVQLAFDHFWHPKSRGGNFLMRHIDGYYINNCIPLCGSCNSSKGKKEIHEFFEKDNIKQIVQKSQSINPEINSKIIEFNDPHFEERNIH